MHNVPGMPLGVFATATGPMLAAVGVFTVAFIGNAGHGGACPARSDRHFGRGRRNS